MVLLQSIPLCPCFLPDNHSATNEATAMPTTFVTTPKMMGPPISGGDPVILPFHGIERGWDTRRVVTDNQYTGSFSLSVNTWH